MSQHLIGAAERGDVGKVREFLEKGADVNFFSKSRGMTALHMAVLRAHIEVARLLVERGADPNLTEPLATACSYGNSDAVALLLDAGADPNLASEARVTPLMVAAKFCTPAVVRRLIDAGGDLTLRSREGKSVVDFARESKWKENAAMLEQSGGAQGPPAPAPAPAIPWPAPAPGDDAVAASPEAALWAYIHAMNRWETESARKFKAKGTGKTLDQKLDEILDALEPIVALHCTPRDRPYGRTSFGLLPEYDPQVESLLKVDLEKPSRAVILTRHERLGTFRYVALKKGGRWLLDNKKIDLSGKWSAWTL